MEAQPVLPTQSRRSAGCGRGGGKNACPYRGLVLDTPMSNRQLRVAEDLRESPWGCEDTTLSPDRHALFQAHGDPVRADQANLGRNRRPWDGIIISRIEPEEARVKYLIEQGITLRDPWAHSRWVSSIRTTISTTRPLQKIAVDSSPVWGRKTSWRCSAPARGPQLSRPHTARVRGGGGGTWAGGGCRCLASRTTAPSDEIQGRRQTP